LFVWIPSQRMESGYPIIRDLKSVVGIDGNVLFQAQEFQTHVNPGQSCEAQDLALIHLSNSRPNPELDQTKPELVGNRLRAARFWNRVTKMEDIEDIANPESNVIKCNSSKKATSPPFLFNYPSR